MGLDWNPLGKPKAGHEQEFEQLFRELEGRELPAARSVWARFFSRRSLTESERKERVARFQVISEPVYASLGAPRVGDGGPADAWLRERLERANRTSELERMRQEMAGYHVLDLLPDCDGFPKYTNYGAYGGLDRYSFRGSFLRDAESIVGEELLAEAWNNKLAPELVEYGAALLERGRRFARENGIDEDAPVDTDDLDSSAFRADVTLSAARWCLYWGERGHGLEAWF